VAQTNGDRFNSSRGAYWQWHKQMEIVSHPHEVPTVSGTNKWRSFHFLTRCLLSVAQINGDRFTSSRGAYCQWHKQMEIISLPQAMFSCEWQKLSTAPGDRWSTLFRCVFLASRIATWRLDFRVIFWATLLKLFASIEMVEPTEVGGQRAFPPEGLVLQGPKVFASLGVKGEDFDAWGSCE
jgi:hypothetical protein